MTTSYTTSGKVSLAGWPWQCDGHDDTGASSNEPFHYDNSCPLRPGNGHDNPILVAFRQYEGPASDFLTALDNPDAEQAVNWMIDTAIVESDIDGAAEERIITRHASRVLTRIAAREDELFGDPANPILAAGRHEAAAGREKFQAWLTRTVNAINSPAHLVHQSQTAEQIDQARPVLARLTAATNGEPA